MDSVLQVVGHPYKFSASILGPPVTKEKVQTEHSPRWRILRLPLHKGDSEAGTVRPRKESRCQVLRKESQFTDSAAR